MASCGARRAARSSSFKRAAKALQRAACERAYREAHDAYRASATATASTPTTCCCASWSAATDARYSALKRERSALDFDDLELLARDLLEADAGLRERYSERFAHVMVDEIPGHQPAPERDPRAARARQPVPGRRRAPVDLPLPPRRRRRVPRRTVRARRPPAGRAHRRELPQPRRDARRHRPRVRGALGRGLRAARGRADGAR